VDELVTAIAAHHAFLVAHGELAVRRERRAAAEVEHIAFGMLRARYGSLREGSALASLAADVAAGRTDPYAAATRLLEMI
jgi:LAO/AO transport system kinase